MDGLDARSLTRMLLESGLLDANAIHDGLRVTEVRRRHQVWTVRVASGTSMVVKQALTDDGRAALFREAMRYEELSASGSATSGALPRLLRYDDRQHALILEFAEGRSLADDIARKTRVATAPAIALGRTLAALHRHRADDRSHGSPAWILSLNRPTLPWYVTSSEASLRLRAAIQQSPVIGPAFDALRETWQPSALIHGDLKLHHVIVQERQRSERHPGVTIIDWETAMAGDPAWDTGTVIAGHLSLWLRSIPLIAGASDTTFMDQADIPLDRVQRAMRAFWDAYQRESGLVTDDARAMLRRSMAFAAARLIQLEEERLQSEVAIGRRTDLIVGVSENILRAPAQAASVLAGVDPGRAASR